MESSADSDAAPIRPAWRLWLLRLVLVCASLLMGLGIAEVSVRAFGLEAPPRPGAPEGKKIRYVPGPSGDRRNAPGIYNQSYQLTRSEAPRITTITIDRRGFRTGVPPVDATPATTIACLGDSYTFGYGVDDDETWPYLLREALNEGRVPPVFETVNAGVNGMNTQQEATFLKEHVIRCNPGLVLLGFYLNDAAIGANAAGNTHELNEPPPLYQFVNNNSTFTALRRRSQLFDMVGDRLVKNEYLEFLGSSRSQLYGDDAPGWKKCQAELLRMRDLCARRQSKFAVVLYPLLCHQGEKLATHDAYEKVASYLQSIEVPFLDLEPEFLKHDVDQLRVHPLDAHPNGDGHRIAARAIAAWLRGSDPPLIPRG